MSVIFFDTDCELWYTQADELGCPVIKMPYTIDGKEYFYDLGRETDFKNFFDRVRAGSMPVTSALNPTQYIEILEPYFQKGEDMLYISFSDQMSGTFEHLQTALNELSPKYPEAHFRRFDTKSISFGGGYQVYFAVKYFQSGKTLDEVVEFLSDFTNHVSVVFMVDSLMHLYKGGRLSAGSAILGTIAGIKPILRVNEEGKLEIYEKVRGEKKVISFFMDNLQNNGLDLENYPIVVIDADNPELSNKVVARIKETYPNTEIWKYSIGPVIGTHCGPGTIGLIYHSIKR